MSRYLLDTNIISDATKLEPSEALATWMSKQDDDDLFIASLTIGEIQRGILSLDAGRRRNELNAWFQGSEGPTALFSGRVLSFNEPAAMAWGALMATGDRQGKPRSAVDTIIAAITLANDCIVVTGNEKHFPDVRVFNPFK